jgi:hypothetical protein
MYVFVCKRYMLDIYPLYVKLKFKYSEKKPIYKTLTNQQNQHYIMELQKVFQFASE